MVKVKIVLVPDDPMPLELQQQYGRFTSDIGRINVNVNNGNRALWDYSILIIPEDFTEVLEAGALQRWLGLIVATLKKNLTDDIELSLSTAQEWDDFGFNSSSAPLFDAWLVLDQTIAAVVASGKIPGLLHQPLPEERVMKPAQPQRRRRPGEITVNDLITGNIPAPDLDGDDDDDDDEDFDIASFAGDDDDDEDDEDDDPPRRSNRSQFSASKVLQHAKTPKRDLKRHGVIIADSRSDIDKDRKMIKAFLKQFIPGNQYWKKELRRTLAMRWIRVYAVSKKTHRELEKEFRRHKHAKVANEVLGVTRSLFTTPLDNWDDPSR